MSEPFESGESGDDLTDPARTTLDTRFMLLNAAQVEARIWADLNPLRLVPGSHRTRPGLFPVLIDGHTLDETQRAELSGRIDDWERETGVSCLLAKLSASGRALALAEHLVERMYVRRPDGQKDALRYYDPWVWRHLQGWLLTPVQLDSLLGPIDAWHWRLPGGAWYTYTRTSERPVVHPVRLTREQWPSILRMAELQRVLKALAFNGDEALASQPQTARQADALLARALDVYHLQDPDDRKLFVIQALRFHPDIHRHPQLRVRLAQSVSVDASYVSACAGLDDARMQQFVREL